MKIHIISVGKLSNKYKTLAGHYTKMIKWKFTETEITYSKKLPENQIKVYEAELINKRINASGRKIILDARGKQLTSKEFSGMFNQHLTPADNISFIIGGAFGLDDGLIKSANMSISLSNMTLPHQLAKVILLEQIYRAQTILESHPYHK